VLADRAAGSPRPIASATKLMTAYLALDRLRPSERVVAPPYAAGPAESLMGLRAGEEISVRDLLYGALLPSGNDAAAALAQASSGSIPEFVDLMNRTAARLDLDDTAFGDPIGLDPASVSSASDLVRLTLRLRESDLFRKIVDTPQRTLRSGAVTRTVVNRNTLVLDVPWVDGVKTGRTLDAGYVLVASGERDGVELISAVLGAPSEAARDSASLELLEYGTSLYRTLRPVSDGERLAAPAIRFQDGERLALVAQGGVELAARSDQSLEVELDFPDEVEGPIRRGERLGSATVSLDGEQAGEVPLVAARAVARATFVERADSALPGGRLVLWGVMVVGLIAAFAAARAVVQRVRSR
jgi:serine-type D-Ala-D-Ala carboxypeptidase (penicillin-binding protein 5/6)